MPVLARDVRDRSFKTVLGGFDSDGVRAALAAAVAAFEHVETEIAVLRQQHATTVREIERIADLERSLLRACVAAEEDARIRCGAARRYATRIIAAAEEQANVLLDGPTRERDRVARDLEAVQDRRRHAADVLERLIAELQQPRDAETPREVAEPALADEAAVVARDHTNESPWPTARTADKDSQVAAAPPGGGPPDPARQAAAPAAAPSDAPMGAALAVANDEAAVPVARSEDRMQPAPPADATASSPADASGDATDRSRRVRVPVAAGAAAAVLLLLQGSAGVTHPKGMPVTAAAFGPADAPADGGRSAKAADGAPAGPLAPAATATNGVPSSPAALTLHLRPLRVCWVRVVVDDRTDARELQPGEEIRLEARRTILLRVGDAGALSVELNGRVLPPLGSDGQVVERRFTAPATTTP
jgi:cell division septum initiation protein DivIVA